MLQVSALTSTDFADYTWPDAELALFNAYMAGLPPWAPLSRSYGPPETPLATFPAPFSVDAVRLHIISAQRIRQAIRDEELDRGHLKVLANLWERFNSTTLTAWPSRGLIAQEEELDLKSATNKLYDLRRL